MRILVFEYILGGGLAGLPLPPSLAAEARAMLQALLADLSAVPGVSILLPLETRAPRLALPSGVERADVPAERRTLTELLNPLITGVDALWPIAPEAGGILHAIAELTLTHGKTLLASSPAAIALCADKLAVNRLLAKHGLPTAAGETLPQASAPRLPAVAKPRDGLGCQNAFYLDAPQALEALRRRPDACEFILQPFYPGPAVSLSALCAGGQGVLLCCNRQQIARENGQFKLQGCQVNTGNPLTPFYADLIKRIAAALPELWGYIGVDLIETNQGPIILEINPRLTTSYAGIGPALGVNPARLILELLHAPPSVPAAAPKSVYINLENPDD